ILRVILRVIYRPARSITSNINYLDWECGGEGGIRTPGGVAPTPHFECGAFDHSATSPRDETAAGRHGRYGRAYGIAAARPQQAVYALARRAWPPHLLDSRGLCDDKAHRLHAPGDRGVF